MATTRPFLALSVFLALSPAAGASQVPDVSPRALAIGGAASDALACGSDALGGNPATLARGCTAPIRLLVLPTVAAGGHGDGPGGAIWRARAEVFDGLTGGAPMSETLAAEQRAEIMAGIRPEGLSHAQEVDVPVVQAPLGRHTAASLTWSGRARGTVARDVAELLVNGFDSTRVAYSVGDSEERAYGFWTLAVGHGRSIGGVDIGITAKVIAGNLLTRWQAFEPEVSLPERRARLEVVGVFAGDNLFTGSPGDFRAPDGFGWGVDVGVAHRAGPLVISAAVENALQRMTWSDDLWVRRIAFEFTPESATATSESHAFDPTTASAAEQAVAGRLRDESFFPRRLRFGAGIATRRASVAAGGYVTQGPGRLTRGRDRQIGVGGEVRPLELLSLRGGAATDLAGGGTLSGGVALHLFGLNIEAAAARIRGGDGMAGFRASAGLSFGR